MARADNRWSRRDFLTTGTAAAIGIGTALSATSAFAAAASKARSKISDVQVMTVQGSSRTYVFVRIMTDDGHFGIGEGYGSPGVAVAEQVLSIKPQLLGKNPLEVEKIFTFLDAGRSQLAGTRTDGSAHNLIRAASAIEMALWDLAGRILETPLAVLLGGQYRDHVRLYDHSKPKNPLDKAECRDWAAKVRAHPSGFTAHKQSFSHTDSIWGTDPVRPDVGRDLANRELSSQELREIGQGYENIRDALGWDHDIMVHCHWEYDLRTSIQLAEAVAPIKPLWLEDPLPVDYTDSWKRLVAQSKVPILMGENLARVEGFLPFINNQACDIVNPDLRNCGGYLEAKRVGDLASIYGIPITNHNTASQLYTYQVAQWAAAVRSFLIGECSTGEGGWEDHILQLDAPYIEKGYIKVNDKPGTGATLNREVIQAHLATGSKWWGDV
jgi:L-alanine-DL-glutamate epimerase-like enolase superfamily enzyme